VWNRAKNQNAPALPRTQEPAAASAPPLAHTIAASAPGTAYSMP
jgi:hypothetical protein